MCNQTGLSEEDKTRIQRVFTDYPQISKVILYGSRAKGNFRTNSDIDMTVVGSLDWRTFTSLENDLDDLMLPYKIDLSLYQHLENKRLLDHIQRMGQEFYTKHAN